MSIKNACSDIVAMHLPHNFPLCNLITTVLASIHDDLPFPTDKLIGEDWDFAVAGQKVKVTWTDPYREDEGYLLFLPGLASDDIYKGAIVHIPSPYNDDGYQQWFALKHLAILADQLELMPNLC